MGYVRDKEKLQPEVCDVTGRLVPAEDGVIAEAEGLEGSFVGDTQPWLASVRSELSFNQTRGLSPPPSEEPDLGPHGGRAWWASWTPAELGENLIAWWRNDHLELSVGEGNALLSWADESGNGGPQLAPFTTPPVLAPRVVRASNGRLALRLSATSATDAQRLLAGFPVVADPFTVCAAFRFTAANDTSFGGSAPFSTDGSMVRIGHENNINWRQFTATGSWTHGLSRDTLFHSHVAFWGGVATSSYLRIDGSPVASAVIGAASIGANFVVGCRDGASGDNRAPQELLEMFVVDRELSSAELSLVEEYLAGLVEP